MIATSLALALATAPPLATLAPAPAEPAPATDPESLDAPPSVAQQAALDVASLLGEDTKEYLQARARLAEHPVEAAEAILDRLAVVPAPTDPEKKRLLDVLAEVGTAEHLPLLTAELRRALKAADTDKTREEALDRWLPLLHAQGDAAKAPLTEMVGDQDLSLVVRARLLDTVVQITDPSGVPDLVVLVGRGHRRLRETLVRALQRRSKDDPALREQLLARVDGEIDREQDVQRLPSLLRARASWTRQSDPAFVAKLGELARDDEGAFGVRVAAIRALARDAGPNAVDTLAEIADTELAPPRRGTQAGEVLAWLALSGLPEARAATFVDRHRLRDADAPRLAALGWSVGAVGNDHAWLPASQNNPWPQVRQAAVDRVGGTCSNGTRKYLRERAEPGGEAAPAVARATVTALGRCGDFDALERLMNDDKADVEQRTEAARQLAKRGGPEGADRIARALDRGPDRRMARRLSAVLRHVPKPTEHVIATLCDNAVRGDEVATAAQRSLVELELDPVEACAVSEP